MFTYHIPFHKVKLNIIEFLSLNSNFQSFIFQYNRARLQLCGHVIMPKMVVEYPESRVVICLATGTQHNFYSVQRAINAASPNSRGVSVLS